MALFNFYLNIHNEYKNLLNELIKYTTLLISLNWLIINSNIKNAFNKAFLNNDFILLLLYIYISFIIYYCIVQKLILIK